MKRTICLFSLSSLVLFGGGGVAEAQIVQVGPGYVKAPFVRVYRTPNGTAVRAPFTHVERAPAPYGRPARRGYHADPRPEVGLDPNGPYENGAYDTAADLSLLERQRRLVATSARRLERDLQRFRTGSHWQNFLRLPVEVVQGNRVTARGAIAQPDPAAVQAVLDNFDSIAASDEYRQISGLRSFGSTHKLLREYMSLMRMPTTDPLPPVPSAATPGGQSSSVLLPPAVQQQPEELPLPSLNELP